MEFTNEAIVLLAAGNSSRMGQPKQTMDIGGQTMLGHAVNCAINSQIPNVVVVLGAHLSETENLVRGLPVISVVNADWERGIGKSVKCGVCKAIERNPLLEGIMLMVCDQPKISVRHINEMGRLHIIKGPLAVVSEYRGITGLPALFDRSVFSHLLQVDDHWGINELLQKIKSEVISFPFPGGEIDLDTLEDYQNFIGSLNKKVVS